MVENSQSYKWRDGMDGWMDGSPGGRGFRAPPTVLIILTSQMSCLGDTDSDGKDEVVIGAPYFRSNQVRFRIVLAMRNSQRDLSSNRVQCLSMQWTSTLS